MRKILFIFLLNILFLHPVFCADYNAVLVADVDTGKILYQENANELNYPASLTKIMTLYLTFDALEHGRLRLDDYLIVSQYAANAQQVKLGLTAGSKITVEDAIKAIAVHSANDVARVLAENLKGGKEGNFADLMTRVANEIGLQHTNFENSSGLPNDDHLSTARDIALLAMAVYKHYPQYWKYFSVKTWNYNGQTYTNTNRLLGNYPGCDGMKTGFTNKSKYSLVATAKRGETHLMAVVLGAKNKDVRATVATDLLNRGFRIMGQNTEQYVSYKKPQSNNPVVQYAQKINNVSVSKKVFGTSGIQFGAFSSYDKALKQQKNVSNITGLTTNIEQTQNGLYRVRANNLSETDALKIKDIAVANGIDCYIFH